MYFYIYNQFRFYGKLDDVGGETLLFLCIGGMV